MSSTITPFKHWLIARLCHRVEMRTPPEVIARVTGYGLPITYDHLNWIFDRSYDQLSTHHTGWLLAVYLLGGQGVNLG